MRPAELLRLAHVLAQEAGGYPRWMARNRAVSTAYYALFHAIAEFCGLELIGAWRPYPAFRHVYRSLDHGRARSVLDAARRDRDTDEAIKIVAEIFNDLQDKRHQADYDPGYRISSADLARVLADTGRAVSHIADIRPAERKFLAARLIGRTRG